MVMTNASTVSPSLIEMLTALSLPGLSPQSLTPAMWEKLVMHSLQKLAELNPPQLVTWLRFPKMSGSLLQTIVRLQTRSRVVLLQDAGAALPPNLARTALQRQDWPKERDSQTQFLIACAPNFGVSLLGRQATSTHYTAIATEQEKALKFIGDYIGLDVVVSSPSAYDFFAQLLLENWKSNETSPGIDSSTVVADSLRLKDELLSNLIHELLPPLTNMKTALRLLESRQLKRDQRQRYLDMVQRECDRQNSLIEGVNALVELDSPLSAMGSGLQLDNVVPGIVSTYQPLAAERGITLGYTIPADLPLIHYPEGWIRQIILNLLSNALKFTETGGRVFVQADARPTFIEISVRDTGVGIDPEEQTKIFGDFYRGRSAVQQQTTGAGLGLTVVQRLAQRCGGEIKVVSQLEKGSVFTVTLPLGQSE